MADTIVEPYSQLEVSSSDYSNKTGLFSSLNATKKLCFLSATLGIVSIGLLISLTIVVVSNKEDKTICLSEECILTAGYLSASMDLNVDPCDDFYEYVCGNWKQDHPFPANIDGWSHFYKLSYAIRNNLRKLLDDKSLMESSPKAIEKLYNFYHGCINQSLRNSIGYTPLFNLIEDVGGWPTIDNSWSDENYEWENAFVSLIKVRVYLIMKIEVINDKRNTSQNIIQIGPSLLSPQQITRFSEINLLSEEVSLIANITEELTANSTDTTQIANDTYAVRQFRQKLLNSVSPLNSIDYYQQYYENHIFHVNDLNLIFPGINFYKILTSIFNSTIDGNNQVFVPDIAYLKKVGSIIASTDNRTIANYFGSQLALSFGEYTKINMYEIIVEDLDTTAPEILPNMCFDLTEELLPDLLGRLYIDNFYRQNSREDMKFLISLVHNSFYETLNESDWMDASTKQQAINKLDAMSQNVAYADWTVDDQQLDRYYDKIGEISSQQFFASVLRINEVIQEQQFMALKNEDNCNNCWPSHNAIDVNSFYYYSTNGIYFPAGMAEYPFYMYGRPMSMNLGSIGMIIGHEMTHGFDINGCQYDSYGNLKNWWTNSTRDLFLNKSKCFLNQYNKFFFPELNLSVNGLRTLGENIADNGGVNQAYRALQSYKRNFNDEIQYLPGSMARFTSDQLFFISFANMWCTNTSPKGTALSLNTSVHSPESVRVKASLANFDHFARTFNCPLGSNMNPVNKCILW